MKQNTYRSMPVTPSLDRRDFMKIGGAAGVGLLLGGRTLFGAAENQTAPAAQPARPKTNIDDALKVPRTKDSLPGLFPGRVVEVRNPDVVKNDKPVPEAVNKMFEQGLTRLTDQNLKQSFALFFTPKDIVGIKVNPVGPGLISTRPEVIDPIVSWLAANGIARQNIIIWDRFDYMLKDAGFTPERYPGVGIEGLQTMDEAAAEGKTQDNSRWLKADGTHVSADNFDKDVYYWADVEGPKDNAYLNQHVFNGKYSYFGKLLTKKLTKIINVAVFKNTGNGISMATKNLGYGAVCNTNRLHQPLSFEVNTEVLAFPVLRDKLVLNITDGLRGQYEGGPSAEAKFAYWHNTLYFATDPFALDMVCQQQIVAKRKSMGVKVNEHPKFTEYLRYAEKLGLGAVSPGKINHIRV
jgi:CBS domain-containing protein